MRVAINGFGRIGRLVYRILMEDDFFDVVAINDLSTSSELAYLLKYDSTHRNYNKNVTVSDSSIIVDNKKTIVLSEKDPLLLPWKDLDIDLVFECTGRFTKEEDAKMHIKAGCKKVLVSAPCKGNVKTIVYGVNENTINNEDVILSAASCTTNCLAPVVKLLNDNYKIKKGFMTTIHAYTNDQVTLDLSHKKGMNSRRGRACATNIVPTSTGAARAIGKVIPSLEGKLSGGAIRVPVSDGSLVDLSLELEKEVSIEDINELFINNKSEVLNVTCDPIVSSDVIGTTAGAIVDLSLTNVLKVDNSSLVKIVSWYDNEYGYSSQMVRTAKYFLQIN